MTTLNFIIGLKRSYRAFQDEQEKHIGTEYYLYLRALTFYAFIEHVIAACVMYPRSIQSCHDNLTDLSYGIYSNLGLDRYHLTHENQNSLCRLVLEVGHEVISQLDGHRYYMAQFQIPRESRNDVDYATDLTAVCDVTKINPYTYEVEVKESDFNEQVRPIFRRVLTQQTNNRSLQ